MGEQGQILRSAARLVPDSGAATLTELNMGVFALGEYCGADFFTHAPAKYQCPQISPDRGGRSRTSEPPRNAVTGPG
jgi:hypothetical protein